VNNVTPEVQTYAFVTLNSSAAKLLNILKSRMEKMFSCVKELKKLWKAKPLSGVVEKAEYLDGSNVEDLDN
jgi:hypothetical protein